MVADLGTYVEDAAARGLLVVQPRMGMPDPDTMAAGIAAVAGLSHPTVATITVDSYTRVGDHHAAARALASGADLNGFPIVAHGPGRTARVAAAAGPDVPVQVRHGSASPAAILSTMTAAGLTATEGGPVSYCLPYGRTPLAESVDSWSEATRRLAEQSARRGRTAHLETFGGCMLGQLCPPSLLIAISALEALFFAQHGIRSVSLSYAQQCHPVQDIEALAALGQLAGELLPADVDRHLVVYTYMGVFPRTAAGARSLLDASARIAVLGGAHRLIVKTEAEAHRIPTVAENLLALNRAAGQSRSARHCGLPGRDHVDYSAVLEEARRLVHAVLDLSGDVGQALLRAFAHGILDVPYCLHEDNLGLSRGAIDQDGRLCWAEVGQMPLPAPAGGTRRRVTSGDLLRMLRSTADTHDRAGLAAATQDARSSLGEEGGERPLRVAVVGSGPRGISVLERLAARAAEGPADTRIEVSLIDDAEIGCGRVWRTDQSPWVLMNTAAGEVTMFSGPPDGGPPRAGAGPSLAQWWATVDPDQADPNGYAPRALYGRYLRFVLDRIEAGRPDQVVLHRVAARVEDLRRTSSQEWVLALSGGRQLTADRVVLATGHPVTEPQAGQRSLADFAAARRGLGYIRADGTEKRALEEIPAGATVGVIGLGLSFYDLMAQVTLGRGGRFADDGSGGLRYLPSGREPVLVAGSRSGLPLPARGRNQKPADHSYRPVLFTMDRIRQARAARQLDFNTDVLPFLAAEIDVVHCLAMARSRGDGEPPEQALRHDLAADVRRHGLDEAMSRFRERIGLTDLPPLNLEALARPFQGRFFTSAADYRQAVRRWIDQDLAEAARGNVAGPLKAALDVLRDVRSVLRAAVDFGGLTPRSHRDDFLGGFVPVSSFLSTGPPMVRLAQTRALLDAGVLTLAGPQTRFGTGDDRFLLDSPQVNSPARAADIMFDARTPTADLAADTSGLSRRLRARGVLTTYTNASGGSAFATGGVRVTPSPFHPVGLNGPDHTLYVIGIPSEYTRWFTQVGSGRPQVWSGFTADSDAIAADLLAAAPVPGATVPLRPPAMLLAGGPA